MNIEKKLHHFSITDLKGFIMLFFKKIKTFFFVVLLLFISVSHGVPSYHAITFKPEEGKYSLGHNVCAYSIAKLLSFKYDVPFFAVPFEHSDMFSIQAYENYLDDACKKKYACTVEVTTEDQLLKTLRKNSIPTLFVVNSTTGIHYKSRLSSCFYCPKIYENIYLYSKLFKHFGSTLKKALTIKNQVTFLTIPENQITVAIHVKRGFSNVLTSVQYKDEWDQLVADKIAKQRFLKGIDYYSPLKFPPEQFYVDQLMKLSSLLNHAPLFVCVFTDGQSPKDIVDDLRKRVNLLNVTFSCGQKDVKDRHLDSSLIFEDLYNISRFDCLIKPESAFPLVAQLMGNHKIIIYPQGAQIYKNNSLNCFYIDVDNASIIFNNHDTQETKHEKFFAVTDLHRQQASEIFKGI